MLPMDVEVDGCIATILEVAKLPLGEYQASVQVRYRDVLTRVFQVVYKDGRELAMKLRTEIAKLKWALMLYGKEELRRRGIIL